MLSSAVSKMLRATLLKSQTDENAIAHKVSSKKSVTVKGLSAPLAASKKSLKHASSVTNMKESSQTPFTQQKSKTSRVGLRDITNQTPAAAAKTPATITKANVTTVKITVKPSLKPSVQLDDIPEIEYMPPKINDDFGETNLKFDDDVEPLTAKQVRDFVWGIRQLAKVEPIVFDDNFEIEPIEIFSKQGKVKSKIIPNDALLEPEYDWIGELDTDFVPFDVDALLEPEEVKDDDE